MLTQLDKEKRHQLIQELVAHEHVSTQSELVQLLQSRGVCVTQATISRDIKALQLQRILVGHGHYRYSLGFGSLQNDATERLRHLFQHVVQDIDRGEHTLVIRTTSGQADNIARLLEHLKRDDIIGAFSNNKNDDKVLLIARSCPEAEELLEELHSFMLDE